jgi:hypothetical protein
MPTKVFDAFTRLDASDVNDYLANKSISNAFINGAFDFWQRGTSFTGNQYIADRWSAIPSGTGTTTYSRVDVSTDSSVVGQFALQITKSSGSTTGDYFLQRIEDVKSVTGQVTYSLYAKANAETDITVYGRQYFGTGGSPSSIVDVLFGTISVPSGSTFQRYSLTGTLASLAGKTVGTNGNDYVEFFAIVSNSANATLTVTNIQLEPGTVANDFRRNGNNLQDELAACQRYYQRINSDTASGLYWSAFQAISTTATIGAIWLATTMRSAPAISFSSAGHFSFFNVSGSGLTATVMTATVTSPNFFRVNGTVASGLVAGNATVLNSANASAFIEASAEL